MAFLYKIQADGAPAECWELGDKPMVVGRSEAVDASVDDDALSRGHFLIMRDGADFFIVDLDSHNGTWVNGRRVSTHKLGPDDLINAGGSLFCFADPTAPASASPTEVTAQAVADAARKVLRVA